MSRTSRRISRPLIALLGVVIVLGVFFTVHKLRSAHAAQARRAAPVAPSTAVPQPVPQAAPATQPSSGAQASGSTLPTGPGPARPVDAEAGALVTQTPAEKPREDSSRGSQPAAVAASLGDTHSNEDSAEHESARTPETKTEIASTETVTPATAAPAPAHALPEPPVVSATVKPDLSDLVSARQILNEGLVTGRLSGAEADSARKRIEDINQTLVFSARKFPDDPWGGSYQVAGGERLGTIAGKHALSWELLARVNGVSPKKLRSGQWIKVFKGPFHAVVYKSQFRMELYLGAPGGPGSMYIRSYPVGLGKDNSTPTGLWVCKAGDKIRNPRYYPPRGGDIIAPDDPKNPLAGYWIAIEGLDGQAVGKESYGIHGTIDPSSIGRQESMGCIRLKPDDISWVFDLLVDGKSKVLVKD